MAFVSVGAGRTTRNRKLAVCQAEQARLQEITSTLKKDLPRQYDEVTDLDFSIYTGNMKFDDPWTKLRGKLLYRGMLLTIFFIKSLVFSQAEFDLHSCDIVETDKIRTTWTTRGRTRLGQKLELDGTDYFHVNDDGLVYRHESQWGDFRRS
mmetsp:Transcript_1166/g.3617  ORF Transcript_1166/g.3617 Transcript_1166/m.3617 type:complete len:151 (-) Transcript_1166:72-524(-)